MKDSRAIVILSTSIPQRKKSKFPKLYNSEVVYTPSFKNMCDAFPTLLSPHYGFFQEGFAPGPQILGKCLNKTLQISCVMLSLNPSPPKKIISIAVVTTKNEILTFDFPNNSEEVCLVIEKSCVFSNRFHLPIFYWSLSTFFSATWL